MFALKRDIGASASHISPSATIVGDITGTSTIRHTRRGFFDVIGFDSNGALILNKKVGNTRLEPANPPQGLLKLLRMSIIFFAPGGGVLKKAWVA